MPDQTKLERLCSVEPTARDSAWAASLVGALYDTRLVVCDPQITRGPDNFPYFGLALGNGGATATLGDVLPFCTEKAHCGLVLFRDARRTGKAEWVFSFGDLWSLRLFGGIDGDPADSADSAPVQPAEGKDTQVLIAAPSETFLPAPIRQALGRFLREVVQLRDPAVALVVVPSLQPMNNLMFNLKASAFRDQAHRDAVMTALAWFLPRHRGVVLLPEDWDSTNFLPLT